MWLRLSDEFVGDVANSVSRIWSIYGEPESENGRMNLYVFQMASQFVSERLDFENNNN